MAHRGKHSGLTLGEQRADFACTGQSATERVDDRPRLIRSDGETFDAFDSYCLRLTVPSLQNNTTTTHEHVFRSMHTMRDAQLGDATLAREDAKKVSHFEWFSTRLGLLVLLGWSLLKAFSFQRALPFMTELDPTLRDTLELTQSGESWK
ncbi:unnamed protein product [Heligmosomoides polygyrus]|uniref:MFS transporter n=1 Tax=Heligmosomoides polygyrus TaxID=6339 RepID=A0A183FX34_HELPZ|nr:unnamed protein product [Heligmosomoides polygyrus]